MVKQELLKVADVRAELALVAAEYVRRYHAKVDTSKARVELAKLRESGLGDSLNAKKLASIIDSTLMRNEWIIAAPVDTMTNNTTIELYSEYSEMEKRIIEDPIIFKASEIGAVIVTMWDKEAEV